MYRITISTTLFALWSCAGTHGLFTNEVVSADSTGDAITDVGSPAIPMTGLPVIDIAATAGFASGTICDDRPAPGSRIRVMRCYDVNASKLGFYEFMSTPDGLKPAATLLLPR